MHSWGSLKRIKKGSGVSGLIRNLNGGDKINLIINNIYRPRFLEGLGGKKEFKKNRNL